MSKHDQPQQIVTIGPLPKDAGRQEVHINPVDQPAAPPHFAAGTAHLVLLLIIGAFLVIIACGVATALTAGAVF